MTIVGLVLFGIGSILETGHDILLKRFKSNPSNKGKFYDQGFAKYIAYPNYAGYILFRSGQGMLSNNILYSSCWSLYQYYFFAGNSINSKEEYLLEKYGEQYKEYIAKTPRLIPGIY